MAILNLRKIEGDAMENFRKITEEIKNLLEKKNHDYGEIWRDLRVSSMTDLILMKLERLRTIEKNAYAVSEFSEQAESSYKDIVNYSIFCMILISEGIDPLS